MVGLLGIEIFTQMVADVPKCLPRYIIIILLYFKFSW